MFMSISKSVVVPTLLLWAAFASRWVNAQLPMPSGLSPGDSYQLVFNTSAFTNGLSSDISIYNDFVQTAADAAGMGASQGVSWRAISSTASIDARVNAVVGANTPVYNTRLGQLEKIADGFSDMWDGSLDSFPSYDEYGQSNTTDAWTGSLTDGLRAPGSALGDASGTAWCGRPSLVDGQWIHFFEPSTSISLHVYALSEPITVTDADFNGDDRVDGIDFLTLQEHLGTTGASATHANGDANGDELINSADLTIWEMQFDSSASLGTAAATVPEPPVLVLALLALGPFLSRRPSLGLRQGETLHYFSRR